MKTIGSGQHLEECTGEKRLTDGEDDVVLQPCHAEVVDHAFDFGISNVGTINVADEIQNGQHGDKSDVDLERGC